MGAERGISMILILYQTLILSSHTLIQETEFLCHFSLQIVSVSMNPCIHNCVHVNIKNILVNEKHPHGCYQNNLTPHHIMCVLVTFLLSNIFFHVIFKFVKNAQIMFKNAP